MLNWDGNEIGIKINRSNAPINVNLRGGGGRSAGKGRGFDA